MPFSSLIYKTGKSDSKSGNRRGKRGSTRKSARRK